MSHPLIPRPFLLLLTGLFPALLLSSCVSPPPPQNVDTGLAIPEAWTATNASSLPLTASWWTSFADPRIERLVEEAWRQNPTLQSAVARLDAAGSQAQIAGAGRWPALTLSGDASRRKQNFIGLPIPGSGSDVLTTHTTTYGVSLNTFWELDLWGRVRSGHQSTLAELQASREELRGAYVSLAAQTIKAWIAAAETERQLQLARRTVESYQITVSRVRSRYQRGLRSSLDLRLAQNNLATAEGLVHQRREQLDRALRQLEILVGRYPRAEVNLPDRLPAVPPAAPAGLPSELLQRRPDLIAAERRLASSQALARQAKASLYPKISLTAGGGTTSKELADIVSSDFSVWSWAANLSQPVLQGGRLRANVRLAQARARQSLTEYATVLLRAFGEVEASLAAEHWLKLREESIAEAADQARAAEKLAQDRYNAGLEDILAVLEAQRRSLAAEGQLITVRRLRLDARVDLHLALGGGFEADPPALSHAKTGEKGQPL